MSATTNAERTWLPVLRPMLDILAVIASLTVSFKGGLATHYLAPLALGVTGGLVIMEWPRYSLRAAQDSQTIVAIVAVVSLLIAPFAHRSGSAVAFLLSASVFVTVIALSRAVLYAAVRHARRRWGWFTERVGIFGTGPDVDEFLITAQEHPEAGVNTVFVPDPDRDQSSASAFSTTIVFPNPTEESQVDFSDRLWMAERVSGRVLIPVPGAAAAIVAGRRYEEVWGLPFACISDGGWERVRRRIRRSVDVIASTLLLVLCSPAMVFGALAVKLSGPGPVLFRQPRVTTGGRSFEILKFRTMPVIENPTAEQDAHRADVTSPLSLLLRKTSIDELPQLLNVFRGDMSIIGPRPEAEVLARAAAETVPGYAHRSRVPAGMTGLAQVHRLRGETSLTERARFDNLAIDRGSLWTDLFVVAPGTVGAVVDCMVRRDGTPPTDARSTDWTPGSLRAHMTRTSHDATDIAVVDTDLLAPVAASMRGDHR